MRILKFLAGLLLLAVLAIIAWLLLAPPELLRVATNYSAKMVCSNVFIAGRDANEVLKVDVQAPGHPLLKFISIDVDGQARTVGANLFGFVAGAKSQYREGLGCTNLHGNALSDAKLVRAEPSSSDALWPDGNRVNLSQDPELLQSLSDETLLGEGYRAVVVIKDGRIIGETYAPGFDANTPLLGWSMTKTVTAALIGALIQSGDMALTDPLTGTYPDWASDTRKTVTLEAMLAMSSGLQWNEEYGDVSDVTRMLFLRDDMAGFASQFGLEAEAGSVFKYSSGTSTMLSRAWQDKVGENSLEYPSQRLFKPLGMASAVMETDTNDTFVGSSYMYATARDWGRFGQFLLQKGNWNGKQILPAGFADFMFEPVSVSGGRYTKGHMWREIQNGTPRFEDAVWLRGHDGQSIGILPSRNLVVVRMGLTPSKLGYSPLPFVKALVASF